MVRLFLSDSLWTQFKPKPLDRFYLIRYQEIKMKNVVLFADTVCFKGYKIILLKLKHLNELWNKCKISNKLYSLKRCKSFRRNELRYSGDMCSRRCIMQRVMSTSFLLFYLQYCSQAGHFFFLSIYKLCINFVLTWAHLVIDLTYVKLQTIVVWSIA